MKSQFSYTKISCYRDCPMRYRFQYVDKLPTFPQPYFSFGSSMHATLHKFHQSSECPEFEILQEYYRQSWISSTGYATPQEEQEYFNLGLTLLKKYHHRQLEEYQKPLLMEERFRLDFGPFILSGIIDRVDRHETGILEVIDYKTSQRKMALETLDNQLQLAIYGFGTKEILGQYPDYLSYYYLRHDQKNTIQPDQSFFSEVYAILQREIERIIASHEHDRFEPIVGNRCRFCDFLEHCPAGLEKFPQTIQKVRKMTVQQEEVKRGNDFEEIASDIIERAGETLIESQLSLLRQYFPFDHFRRGQLEVILSLLLDKEVLAVMPTGAGKSLCYQLLSLQMEKNTIIISPLIALMKDQVEGIQEFGFSNATYLNTSLSGEQYSRRIRDIVDGKTRLIYLAPEALRNRNIIRVLEHVGISLLVVDEAHCISQWGHDFRPDYLILKNLRNRWSNCRILAMTATAPPPVQDDIIQQLGCDDMARIVTSIDRPNLFLEVTPVLSEKDKVVRLQQMLIETEGDGIVYVSTRKHAEKIAEYIKNWGIPCHHYHAGLAKSERTRVQDAFMQGKLRVIVATNAFGMGIDKPDIRFINHFHLPGNLESYYQEIGRAGRDGAEARVALFYSESDHGIQQYFIEETIIAASTLRHLMLEMKRFQWGDYLLIPHGALEEVTGLDETQIRVAISQMEKEGIVERIPDLSLELILTLYDRRVHSILADEELALFNRIKELLGGAAMEGIPVRLIDLAAKLNLDPQELEESLLTLKMFNVLRMKTMLRGTALRIPEKRPPTTSVQLAQSMEKLARQKIKKLDQFIEYALTPVCRRIILKEYFGDPHDDEQCGFCDNCRGGALNVVLFDEPADGLFPINAILELIQALNFAIGRNRIAEILKGSKRKDLLQRNFNLIPQFGSFSELSLKQIRALLDMSLRVGLISVFYKPDDKLHRYPLLKMTMKGKNILQHGETKYLPITEEEVLKTKIENNAQEEVEIKKEKKTKVTKKTSKDKVAFDADQKKLYEELRKWRIATAQRFRTKPYMVFSNATLEEIVLNLPQSYDELLEIKGIGSVKVADYGQQILKVVEPFC